MNVYGTNNPNILPPELFPIIASFIPLRSAPSSLYSLALGNRRLYRIVRPLIYSRLVLRSEGDALEIIRRIIDSPNIGRFVKEIHILSDLKPLAQGVRRGQDIITGLSSIIRSKSLPVLEALGIYLLMGWRIEEGYRNVPSHGNVPTDFWENLRENCPRLRALFLRGLATMTLDRRFNGSSSIADGINLLNLNTLSLDMMLDAPMALDVGRNILANLPRLASGLHNLTLGFSTMRHLDPTPLLALHFPCLRSLILKGFAPPSIAEASLFWERHSSLERVFLIRYEGRWFGGHLQAHLLPNLKYFKASFMDVRALAPILPRLVSLSITLGVNGQIPYLLRSVIPHGLPGLKSLEFVHFSTSDSAVVHNEGAKWYETVDGAQLQVINVDDTSVKLMLQTFMLSIARGAPNVEEIGFMSNAWTSTELLTLRPFLARFHNLRRIYYPSCFNLPDKHLQADDGEITQRVYSLAQSCLRLESVTDTDSGDLPYPAAKIIRAADGTQIESISIKSGLGMEMLECEKSNPFPQNIPMS